ncbi:MAG: CvpA family protein [Acidobacteria bacterium]|nr:CvpA family protein [Acidobacteriota bacterium]
MTWLDFLLLTVFAVSVAISVWRGFIREIVSMVSVVGALVVAGLGYRWAGGFFEDLARDPQVARGIGFLALFFIVLGVGIVASTLLRRLVKVAGLNWFDRFLGGTFGVLRGLLIGSVILLVLTAFDIKSSVTAKSLLAPYFIVGARAVVLVMPQELKTQFRDGYQKFRRALVESE